jgi:hypothetical protein
MDSEACSFCVELEGSIGKDRDIVGRVGVKAMGCYTVNAFELLAPRQRQAPLRQAGATDGVAVDAPGRSWRSPT